MTQRSKSISNRRQVKSSTTTRSASQNAKSKARRNTEVLGGTQILVSPPPPSPYLRAESPTKIDKCHKCLGMSKSRRLAKENRNQIDNKLNERPPFNLDTHIDSCSDDENEYCSHQDDEYYDGENGSDRNSMRGSHRIQSENDKNGQQKREKAADTVSKERLGMRKKANNKKPTVATVVTESKFSRGHKTISSRL